MTPVTLIFLFVLVAVILLLAELLLPSHGILGILGGICMLGAVGVCFYVNRWLGAGVLTAGVLVSPLVAAGLVRLWERSPIGRRVVLTGSVGVPQPPPRLRVGQVGVAVSELRPMGEVEFDDRRVEAISEFGMIQPGSRVKVLSIANNVVRVRSIE